MRSLLLVTLVAAGAFVLALALSAVGLLALELTVTSEADVFPLVLLWVGGVVLVVAGLAVVAVGWLARRPAPAGRSGGPWGAIQQRYGGTLRLADQRVVGLVGGRFRGLTLEVLRPGPTGEPSAVIRLSGGGNLGADWELAPGGRGLAVRSADAGWGRELAAVGVPRIWEPFGPGLRRLTYAADGAVLTYEGAIPEAVEQLDELLAAMAQTLTAVAYAAGRPAR